MLSLGVEQAGGEQPRNRLRNAAESGPSLEKKREMQRSK
jgi:hypothetical protein